MACIHIIEDDRDMLALIKTHLLSRGFKVCDDFNGDFFTTHGHRDGDLYLVDINLNNRSGIDICEKVKASHLKPVILMSANIHLEAMAAACNADAFIQKPFRINDLLFQINRFIPPPVLLSTGA